MKKKHDPVGHFSFTVHEHSVLVFDVVFVSLLSTGVRYEKFETVVVDWAREESEQEGSNRTSRIRCLDSEGIEFDAWACFDILNQCLFSGKIV
jgi:hypothetical protein